MEGTPTSLWIGQGTCISLCRWGNINSGKQQRLYKRRSGKRCSANSGTWFYTALSLIQFYSIGPRVLKHGSSSTQNKFSQFSICFTRLTSSTWCTSMPFTHQILPTTTKTLFLYKTFYPVFWEICCILSN